MTTTSTSKTCTVRIHADGTVCGETAVTSFTTRDGETFAECAEHEVKVGSSEIKLGDLVRTFHIGVNKVGTVVARSGNTLKVQVPIQGGAKVITRKVSEVDAV